MSKNDAIAAYDDGLICPDVGPWAETKHNLISYYAKLFSSGMKEKWKMRVYVELYAAAGYAKIRGTEKIIYGSPIRALTLDDPFDKYIFCEQDTKRLDALKARVIRHAPQADVHYVQGNCNDKVDEILRAIPRGSAQNNVLTLCFVDPPDIGIKFRTISKLSERYVDFLVLLALYMDANRNLNNYLKEQATKIDEFLGSEVWREQWKQQLLNGTDFPRFLAEQFSNSMEILRYKPQPLHNMKAVTISEGKNNRLYRLALFSRHHQAYVFWKQVLKYITPQTAFTFEDGLGE